MHRLISRASVALVVIGLAIAGCGGGTGGAPLQPPAPTVSDAGGLSSGGQAASAAPQASPGSTGGTAVTCNQLTNSDVQPLLVDPILNLTVTAAGVDGEGQQCVFDTGDSAHAVDVLVLSGDMATTGYAQDVHEMTKPVSVPGIGEKASRDTNDSSVDAITGDIYCSVSLAASNDVPGVAQLEDAAGGTANIGDRAEGIIAAALGTLCNRIYGGGNTTPDLSGLSSTSASPTSPWPRSGIAGVSNAGRRVSCWRKERCG